jgi:hypothetical protein
VFDAVGFIRDLRYYREVLNNQIPLPRVGYSLPISVIPGWVTQARDFWSLTPFTGDAKQLLLGGLIPLLMIGIIVVGLKRYRISWALVALAAVCAAFAEYSYVSQQQCTYCGERDLLPLGPIVAIMVGLGLCALLTSTSRRTKLIGLVGVVIVVAAVGGRARIELERFSNSSYFMEITDRVLVNQLPARPGAVLEEGFGASTAAQAEQPLVYHLIGERTGGRPSVVLGSDSSNGIQYLNFGAIVLPPTPSFDTNYRYVLTRLAGIRTGRKTIARIGGLALEERTAALDVTPYSGLGAPLARLDSSGTAYVQTYYLGLNAAKTAYIPLPDPLRMVVAGSNDNRPVWVRLTFWSQQAPTVKPQHGVTARFDGRHTLVACVRAVGQDPVRYATIQVNAPVVPGPAQPGAYPPAMPYEGLDLTAMRAVSGSCRI